MVVRSWLVNQVDTTIINEFWNLTSPTTFANNAFEAIKNIVVGTGHFESRTTYVTAIQMRRDDYASIEQYVTNFQSYYQYSNKLGTTITPYSAMLLMLKQLQPELPNWVSNIENNFKEDAVKSTKENNFFDACKAAIDRGKEYASSYATTNPQTTYNRTANNKPSFNRFGGNRKRHFPPKGTTANDWAKQWRQSTKQKDDQDNCAFCNQPNHGTVNCYYLSETSPSGWEPIPDLWCYNH